MIIQVRFFGSARQFIQPILPEMERYMSQDSFPKGTTTDDLLQQWGVRSDRLHPLISRNGRHHRTNVGLQDKERIDLVPPMAGVTP